MGIVTAFDAKKTNMAPAAGRLISLPGGDCSDDGDEILQVDTYPLTIYCARAFQELHMRVKRLAVENLELREQLATLRAEVTTLAKTVGGSGPPVNMGRAGVN